MLGPFGSLELMDPLSWGAEVLLTDLLTGAGGFLSVVDEGKTVAQG